MERETGEPFSTKLSVIEDKFLTEEEGGACGGVVLYANNRKIVCQNALEDILALTFVQDLPQIRNVFFPENELVSM